MSNRKNRDTDFKSSHYYEEEKHCDTTENCDKLNNNNPNSKNSDSQKKHQQY